ncbi:MAG: hypothetical protein WDN28_29005 [Chthoniobacter sp.]
MKLSRVDRCYRLYSREYESLLAQRDVLIISYESLMDRPAEVTALMAERLGLEFGVKTKELIGQISERNPRDRVPVGASPELRDEAIEIHRRCALLAI